MSKYSLASKMNIEEILNGMHRSEYLIAVGYSTPSEAPVSPWFPSPSQAFVYLGESDREVVYFSQVAHLDRKHNKRWGYLLLNMADELYPIYGINDVIARRFEFDPSDFPYKYREFSFATRHARIEYEKYGLKTLA